MNVKKDRFAPGAIKATTIASDLMDDPAFRKEVEWAERSERMLGRWPDQNEGESTKPRHINVRNGTKLTPTEIKLAWKVTVGGVVIKDRNGHTTGEYDFQTGIATCYNQPK